MDQAPETSADELSESLSAPPQRWFEAFRRAVAEQRDLLAAAPTTADRDRYEGIGEGGDRTLEIDRQFEDAVFEQLEALADDGVGMRAISEERGAVELGGGEGPYVVIDPIDGSLNARRTLPQFSLSIALATGTSMADVTAAYVYDFGADEEYLAVRGRGATLDGRRLDPADPGSADPKLEVVGLEAVEPGRALPVIEALDGAVYRVRVVGSIALSLCLVAAGRLDGMLSCRGCRSVDAAAGQLIAQEAGAVVSFGARSAEDARLDLDDRYAIAAARTAHGLELISDAVMLVDPE